VVERDFNSLWNTGYFEKIQRKEDTPKCVQLVVIVVEKPTIREINYKGINAVTQSDVLERYKKDKVPFSVESQYDLPGERAETVLRQLLAEHDTVANIRTEIKTIPPASVSVTFNIKGRADGEVGKMPTKAIPMSATGLYARR